MTHRHRLADGTTLERLATPRFVAHVAPMTTPLTAPSHAHANLDRLRPSQRVVIAALPRFCYLLSTSVRNA